jgi:hypothetical protein
MRTQKLRRLTRRMLADILTNQEPVFDNHDVEHELLRDHTIALAETLLEFRSAKDPLRAFSAAFGRRILHLFNGQIRRQPVAKTRTQHLGGNPGPNQQWEKVDPTRPIN